MDLTLGQFIYVFRKRLDIAPHQAVFFSVGGQVLGASQGVTMGQLDKENRDEDGFLYLTYQFESTFG
jgi:GABA(A) receptor-associated protein